MRARVGVGVGRRQPKGRLVVFAEGVAKLQEGDAVVGDDDGVVVVPARIAAATATYARQHEEVEEVVKAQLEAERVSPGRYYPFNDRTWDLYEQKTGKKRP